jgi:hypothetical protein
MTDEEALAMYDNMVLEYGDKLPDPEHRPIEFKYLYKLYKWTHKDEPTSKTTGDTSQDTNVQ